MTTELCEDKKVNVVPEAPREKLADNDPDERDLVNESLQPLQDSQSAALRSMQELLLPEDSSSSDFSILEPGIYGQS